jgi:tyrosine-protein phosphatase SIW14
MRSAPRLLQTALALAIALSPALPAAARTGSAAVSAGADALTNVRIDNFGRINDRYFRGAQPEGQDYADLARLGVKTIIDLQEAPEDPSEARTAKALGMSYYRIPMSTRRPPTSEQLAFFFKLVNDPAAQPVYVHCKGGRHRTGVMTAAYRMSFDGWTADQAFGEMKRYDFGPDFLHPEFKRYVYGYDPKAITVAPAVAVATQQ